MTPSASEILRAVAATLERSLTPLALPSSWAASELRSCLALLAWLEARVETEGPALYADNLALRALLGEALASPLAEGELGGAIREVLDRHGLEDPYPAVSALAGANGAYRALLERLMTRSAAHRRATGEGRGTLDHRITAYLLAAKDGEFAMMAKALAMPAI